ncbi:MAG: hypothetical protein JKY17_07245 [Magnetovibrio sp.]|nr:hypothetical protein [Magnetovibrio sp.]
MQPPSTALRAAALASNNPFLFGFLSAYYSPKILTEEEFFNLFVFDKSRADTQLSTSQRKATRVQEERETMLQAKAAKMAKLKALRLAKESADKKA